MPTLSTTETRALPSELRAILLIATSCPELERKFLPHINIERRDVDWNSVFGEDFGSGHTAAVNWAYSIWTCDGTVRDPFANSHSLNADLAIAVIRALCISWGLQ